jgi:hypothetical protein
LLGLDIMREDSVGVLADIAACAWRKDLLVADAASDHGAILPPGQAPMTSCQPFTAVCATRWMFCWGPEAADDLNVLLPSAGRSTGRRRYRRRYDADGDIQATSAWTTRDLMRRGDMLILDVRDEESYARRRSRLLVASHANLYEVLRAIRKTGRFSSIAIMAMLARPLHRPSTSDSRGHSLDGGFEHWRETMAVPGNTRIRATQGSWACARTRETD